MGGAITPEALIITNIASFSSAFTILYTDLAPTIIYFWI